MISTTAKTIAAAFTAAIAIGATTAQSASAMNGPGVRVAGTCSGASSSKLKVKHDDGRLAVEFEVDQNRNGVPWTIELRKDGRLVFQGTRRTLAPSGSFSVERRVAGATGLIKVRATRNGEVCSATARPGTIAQTSAIASQGTSVAGHDVNDDGGHHGNDD